MGTVYKAHDPVLDRIVAIKVPKFQGCDDVQKRQRERFLREARAVAMIRHPQICSIHDYGEQDGQAFVVMDYLEGQSLAQHMEQQDVSLALSDIAALTQSILRPLQAIHEKGVIHRDLKPSNIMLDGSGSPLLMDFGIAWIIGDASPVSVEGAIVGTPVYMAPEQVAAQHEQLGPWTDVYGLGVILYQLLTGTLPFSGTLSAVFAGILNATPALPSSFRTDLDAGLEGIVLRCLAKSPSARYQSALQMAAALDAWTMRTNVTRPSRAAPLSFSGDSQGDNGEIIKRKVRYVDLSVQQVGDSTLIGFTNRELLDARTVNLLREEILSLTGEGRHRQIIVDCGNVRYSSAAVSVIVGPLCLLRKELHAVAGTLKLCNLRPEVAELFRQMKLEKLFDIPSK